MQLNDSYKCNRGNSSTWHFRNNSAGSWILHANHGPWHRAGNMKQWTAHNFIPRFAVIELGTYWWGEAATVESQPSTWPSLVHWIWRRISSFLSFSDKRRIPVRLDWSFFWFDLDSVYLLVGFVSSAETRPDKSKTKAAKCYSWTCFQESPNFCSFSAVSPRSADGKLSQAVSLHLPIDGQSADGRLC